MSEYALRSEVIQLRKMVNMLMDGQVAHLGETDEKVSTNTSDIADNREGITETYETSLANADELAEVRAGLEEVYEMLNTEE